MAVNASQSTHVVRRTQSPRKHPAMANAYPTVAVCFLLSVIVLSSTVLLVLAEPNLRALPIKDGKETANPADTSTSILTQSEAEIGAGKPCPAADPKVSTVGYIQEHLRKYFTVQASWNDCPDLAYVTFEVQSSSGEWMEPPLNQNEPYPWNYFNQNHFAQMDVRWLVSKKGPQLKPGKDNVNIRLVLEMKNGEKIYSKVNGELDFEEGDDKLDE